MMSDINNTQFNILIVDDVSKNIQVLGSILRQEGYSLSFAINGKQALEMVASDSFDLILLDVMMPEMDGFEVCEWLKQQPETKEIPIIFLTAKTETDSIVKGFEIGAVDYVTKPFNARELLARVKTHLALKAAQEELIRKNEEIRRLSIIDSLTGSYNRSYLTEQLPHEIRRARRYQRSLAVIMCDLDHFKRMNDTYGHQLGDHILKECVQHIQGILRENIDWLARYGGEEFLIVLPETDLENAYQIAERLRILLAQKEFIWQTTTLHITASFGVTGFGPNTPDEYISSDTLIKYADHYLYQAKEEGRNRVIRGSLLCLTSD